MQWCFHTLSDSVLGQRVKKLIYETAQISSSMSLVHIEYDLGGQAECPFLQPASRNKCTLDVCCLRRLPPQTFQGNEVYTPVLQLNPRDLQSPLHNHGRGDVTMQPVGC